MFPLGGERRWMLVVGTAILFCGIFIKSSTCTSSDINDCKQKNVLFVSTRHAGAFRFPTEVVYRDPSGTKLYFSLQGSNADYCQKEEFDCNFKIKGNSLILNKEILSKQDIVVISVPDFEYTCMPSMFYKKKTGFLLNIHNCLNEPGRKNPRLSQNHSCLDKSHYDEEACKGLAETDYNITINSSGGVHCVSCKPQGNVSTTAPPSGGSNGSSISLEHAVKIMNNLSSIAENMENPSTVIRIGDVMGLITKLHPKNHTKISIGVTSGDIFVLKNSTAAVTDLFRMVEIPEEASDMAVRRNGSFAGVVLFPDMYQDDPNSSFLNNEVFGIEMGAEISNLSDTIDICYKNVSKSGKAASCRSWNSKGKQPIWTTDGCQTKETADSITCRCSHLTFFAILLSPPPGNISTSDFKSLTYITSIGCGLSVFFLAMALFMHFFFRKRKASHATEILINLFVAMLTLNLSFLSNGPIADLRNLGACLTMAALMHYSLLATFTWFFIQALHLYLNLWKLPSSIKHYTMKLCITGWVTPATVVITLLALGKYDYIAIITDDGNSAQMCWISDAVVHQAVNVGYYAVVFVFTLTIFIITVWQILIFAHTAGGLWNTTSIKTNSFAILGLFLLLGITWAFAFFSHGPLLIPSYYIFTILNSFQGFFLFIYYYNSSKIIKEERSTTVTSCSTVT